MDYNQSQLLPSFQRQIKFFYLTIIIIKTATKCKKFPYILPYSRQLMESTQKISHFYIIHMFLYFCQAIYLINLLKICIKKICVYNKYDIKQTYRKVLPTHKTLYQVAKCQGCIHLFVILGYYPIALDESTASPIFIAIDCYILSS